METLIHTLKARREMLQVTQETLAELSGVALRTVKQLESGKGNVINEPRRDKLLPWHLSRRACLQEEHGTYLLKPIPKIGKNTNQMPANEHLTMQIGKQIYGIETAENALIFFRDGSPAYLTKRFDTDDTGARRAVEDFASLAGTPPPNPRSKLQISGKLLGVLRWKMACSLET
ncbi:MAG: HipA domain-containing protein [Spirosomaceae bacterium]|nr:HipA domain-containing protein [Spirosomataceae bacterium]